MAVTISEVKETFSANGKTRGYALEYRGLSTDSKPTEGVINGASFIEIDTYERFCSSHPNFKNSYAVSAINHIKSVFDRLKEEHKL